SATQRPIEEVARLLAGAAAPRPCAIVDVGHRRALDLALEVPDHELGPIATHELWAAIYDRIAAQVRAHRTTIVFVNTRRPVATGDLQVEELWALVGRAYPFRRLERADFDAVLDMLADGVATRRGRRGALLHLDRVHGRVRARRGARLAAITSGGAIPDNADY